MNVRFQHPDIDALRKEHMLVDMHFHSSHSNDCSTPIDAIARRAKELGVRVALTDHNQIGGVIAARRTAPDLIMPAVEICTAEGKDVIPYFYSAKELEDFYNRVVKPKLRYKTSLQSNSTKLTLPELFDELHKVDCVIALPHPFAMPPRRSYMFFNRPANRPLLKHVDAVEAINLTMLHRQNLAAIGWAMQFDKAVVGGSDGHTIEPLGSVFTVAHANTWEEFLDQIKAKRAMVVGEERTFRHQMLNATMLLREKARLLKNFRERH